MKIKLIVFVAVAAFVAVMCSRDLLDAELEGFTNDNQIMAVQASGLVFGNDLEMMNILIDTAKAMYQKTRVPPHYSVDLFANNLSGALWDNTSFFKTDSACFTATPIVDASLGDTSMQLIGMYKNDHVFYLGLNNYSKVHDISVVYGAGRDSIAITGEASSAYRNDDRWTTEMILVTTTCPCEGHGWYESKCTCGTKGQIYWLEHRSYDWGCHFGGSGGSGEGDPGGDGDPSGDSGNSGGGPNNPYENLESENNNTIDPEIIDVDDDPFDNFEEQGPKKVKKCKLKLSEMLAAFPNTPISILQDVMDQINIYAPAFGIDTKEEMQHFLAQAGHETTCPWNGSNSFECFEEITNYTWTRLGVDTFVTHFNPTTDPTKDSTKADPRNYQRTPPGTYADGEKVFNRAYCCKYGNGPESSGDGYLYRGRGILHLTWQVNYDDFNTHYQANYGNIVNVLDDPDLLANPSDPKIAVISALWFFKTKVIDQLPGGINATTTVEAVTRKVNGKLNGIADRKVLFQSTSQHINCYK